MEHIGKLIQPSLEILDMFKPVEGFNAFYYGRTRNGKTTIATADILELLDRGERVVANWDIKWDGYDQRNSFWIVLLKFFFGKKYFFRFKKENFIYISPDDIEKNIPLLNRLVNVHVFIDEGQWIFNSQIREQDPEKRKLILHGGHHCRTLNIISQRPVNVFKDIRSQINIWYKCEKRFSFPFLCFQKTAIEDMKDDLPDEENPVGRPRIYIPSRRVLNAFNTHAMREKDAIERLSAFEPYEIGFLSRLRLLLSFMNPRRRLEPRRGKEEVKD